ncbi:hypothetical protein [Lysinibacillus sphaericus]|nr:hypothetical protein [Lysinibacillus sphaericus]
MQAQSQFQTQLCQGIIDCARYERNHVEKYTEIGGDVHSVH